MNPNIKIKTTLVHIMHNTIKQTFIKKQTFIPKKNRKYMWYLT